MQTIPANQLLAGLTLAEPVTIRAVVTDSRKVEPGCVFVCFPGERVDGHDYAAGAYRSGAEYIVANHPVEGVPADRTVIVPDSGRAMIRMASNYRMLFNPRMIGVTGSVGKTTTKEFCYAVLSAFGKTLKTEGNQNNDIGVPNTLIPPDRRYRVRRCRDGHGPRGRDRASDPLCPAQRGHHYDDRCFASGKSRHAREYTEGKAGDLHRPARRRTAGLERGQRPAAHGKHPQPPAAGLVRH